MAADTPLVFSPFEQGLIDAPKPNARWLSAGIRIAPPIWAKTLLCLEPFRPFYLGLQQAGFHVVAQWRDEGDADGALLQLGRHKKRNEADLIALLKRGKPHSPIIIAGDKTAGVDSFYKKLKTLVPIDNQYSKNHGRIFFFSRPKTLDELVAAFPSDEQHFGGFKTLGGMFSHGRIDQGSAMLARHFPNRIYGQIADFGAGWGYLALEALKQGQKLSGLDLYEADHDALEVAKTNLAGDATQIPLHFYWHDMMTEAVNGIYDTIISNPPFHEGRKAEPHIGQRFIEVAAKRLKAGGRLLMVANRQLPYETVLKTSFRKTVTLEEANGFKVLEATK